jgi:hypothetical protein
MAYLIRFLRTRGLQRGVFGSSRGWLAVWLAITLGHQLNKRVGRGPERVGRVVLGPGQAVEIRDTGVMWKDDPLAAGAGAGTGTGGRRRGRRAGRVS